MAFLTVSARIAQSSEKVWDAWTNPVHIVHWCFASPDWGVGEVENDLRADGHFKTNMHAKDGSGGFDFTGVYTAVVPHEHLAYTMDDGRKVDITFAGEEGEVVVTEMFEPEAVNPESMQQQGWQAILNNFKRYAESLT